MRTKETKQTLVTQQIQMSKTNQTFKQSVADSVCALISETTDYQGIDGVFAENFEIKDRLQEIGSFASRVTLLYVIKGIM